MFRNYWLVAIRNFKRHRVYSTINLLGLSIGLATCILILLFVQDELSYDRFHKNADRIYRVAVERDWGDKMISWPRAPMGLAAELEERLPEVVRGTRIFPRGRILTEYGDQRFYESNGYYADGAFFEIFSFPFVQGDPETALSDPKSIVVTKRFAQKYFGDEDPMGETMRFPSILREMTVTGVLDDVPQNSHFRFDYLISFDEFKIAGPDPEIYTPSYISIPSPVMRH